MKNLSIFTIQSYFRGFILFALVLVYGTRVSAQYDLLYENHQQNLVRETWAIADDGQGNTYLAGKFAVSLTLGAFTLTNTGVNEIAAPGSTGFVGKFNAASNTWLWAKKITLIPSSGQQNYITYSHIYDLAIDNAGNVYITGGYSGVVSFDHISLSSTKQGSQYTPDIFVAKYNTNGDIVWAKSFGSKAGFDTAKTIALDGSGNIFIGGYFTNKTVTCSGHGPWAEYPLYDVYLAKLNNAGTAQWQKRYASSGLICPTFTSGNNLTTDASGNVFLTGIFSGTVSFGSGAGLTISSVEGSQDAFAVKVNASGTTQWVKAVGGPTNDEGFAVHTDASGSVYVGGRLASDGFFNKYSPSGSLVWTVSPFQAQVNRIIAGDANTLRIMNKDLGFKTISPVDGSVISSDSLVGNGYNSPPNTGLVFITDLAPAGAGYVFSVHGNCGTVTIGNTTLTSYNNCPYSGISSDIFMVRTGGAPPAFQAESDITDPVAASQEFAENELEVYPNPASDQIHVNLPESDKESRLFIQNQFGRTVWSEKFEPQRRNATITFDGNKFQSGIYYLICLSNGDVKTKRFVIDK